MAKNIKLSTYTSNNTMNVDAVPIVFIHGWGLNSGVWQPLLALLSNNSHYQLITVDLPGFGINNEVELSSYTLNNICSLLDKELQKPAIYIGWSLGGLVTTEMALKYPEKVLGLVTVASSPYFVEQLENNWQGIKSNVLESFHQQLAQDTEKTIKGFLKIQAMGSPHIRQDLKLITELVMSHPLPSQKTLNDSLALLSHCDFRKNLAQIKQPFLRLYGSNDSLVPKKVIEKVNHIAPNSESHLFEHASHAPFISHIEEFYQVLFSWLELNYNDINKIEQS